MTSGVADTVSGSDAMVYLVGSQATIADADDNIFMLQSSDVTVNAAHEFFTIRDQPGDETISGFTSTDCRRFSTAEFANYQALSPDIAQVGNEAVITYDANQTVTLTNFQAANLTSTQLKFF